MGRDMKNGGERDVLEGCDPESKPVKLHVPLPTDVQEPPFSNSFLGLVSYVLTYIKTAQESAAKTWVILEKKKPNCQRNISRYLDKTFTPGTPSSLVKVLPCGVFGYLQPSDGTYPR